MQLQLFADAPAQLCLFDAPQRPAVRYLTGSAGAQLENGTATEHGIGLLIQPGNSYHLRLGAYPAWAADNGAFGRHGFDAARFRRMLARPELAAHSSTCLFVAAPDVVCDARATLAQFAVWAREIRAHGLPVALVAQDGLEDLLDLVPWDLVDVLFIGGSTSWKIGRGRAPRGAPKGWVDDRAQRCIDAARARGKRVHMGRVNSRERMTRAIAMGVCTMDGTFLAFGPCSNTPQLLEWLHWSALRYDC